MLGDWNRNWGSANTCVRLSQQIAEPRSSLALTATGAVIYSEPRVEMLNRRCGCTSAEHVSNLAGGRLLGTAAKRDGEAGEAEIDWISRCALPRAPSAHTSMAWIFESFFAVGQTSLSCAHVFVCSPVAELHLSLNMLKGIRTSLKLAPAGTENLALKQPRLKGSEPPAAHAKDGETEPDAKETRKPA